MKKLTYLVVGFGLLMLAGNEQVNAQRITVTIAGNGVSGLSGDSGPGRSANISGPKDVCLDAAQNIYFADKANGRIRMVSASKGIMTTIAGGGASLADGIPATSASINPNYMVMDASGNIYFTTLNEIRRIDASTGLITTIAGSAATGYTGDGGLAIAATLNGPEGICMDGMGNIYVADRWNNVIREISASTGIITTIAGTGASGYTGDGGMALLATLNSPNTVTVDGMGNVFFSDQQPDLISFDFSVIREINATSGIVSTIAGTNMVTSTYGVPATAAELGTITGMCTDRTGNIYCNEMSCSCRRLNMSTDTLELVGGNFYSQGYTDYVTSSAADMNIPYGLFVDNAGTVYVADSVNNRIRKLIQLSHTPSFAFGHGQSIPGATVPSFLLDTTLGITDMDAGQTETWTMITAPFNGTLSGLPASSTSGGLTYLSFPSGVTYTTSSAWADSFQVQVSDGALMDTVTIYVAGITGTTGTTSVAGTLAAVPSLELYPNPASTVLDINWANLRGGISDVLITDVADHTYFRSNTVNKSQVGNTEFDISTLPAGVYLVRINGSEVRKFVKL